MTYVIFIMLLAVLGVLLVITAIPYNRWKHLRYGFGLIVLAYIVLSIRACLGYAVIVY